MSDKEKQKRNMKETNDDNLLYYKQEINYE